MAREECPVLIAEYVQRQPGIEFRIVQPPAFQLSVLIMLYQVVIGIARKSERVEAQRVHRDHI